MQCRHSVSWLFRENSASFKPVLRFDECIRHPMVWDFLSISESSLAYPWCRSIPKGGWSSKTGPFVEAKRPVSKVSSSSGSSCKYKQSSEHCCSKREPDGAETSLCGKEIRLTKQMFVWLTDDLISGVVCCTHAFKARVVPLVDAPKSVSWHIKIMIIISSSKLK